MQETQAWALLQVEQISLWTIIIELALKSLGATATETELPRAHAPQNRTQHSEKPMHRN